MTATFRQARTDQVVGLDLECSRVAAHLGDEDLLEILVGWARDRLGPASPRSDLADDPASFAWNEVFEVGELVRRRGTDLCGKILLLGAYGRRPTRWELHVDTFTHGELRGVEIWDPWSVERARDTDTRRQAEQLGLLAPG